MTRLKSSRKINNKKEDLLISNLFRVVLVVHDISNVTTINA